MPLTPDGNPGDNPPKEIAEPSLSKPSDSDPLDGSDEGWDPVGLAMLARWLTRSYLNAQANPEPDD